MDALVDLLSYDFLRNAVWAALLASVLCGVLGTLVVVKRLVFISGGLSHAAFGGLGVCYFLGVEPLLGAAAVAVVAALALAGTGDRRSRSEDAVIGILWAVGMAVGMVFIARTPGYGPDLASYLFGNILTVERSGVVWTLGFTAVVMALLVLFFKELVAVGFDEEYARVQGVPVGAFRNLLLVLVALAVVLLLRLVGILLVLALLTIPPVATLALSRSLAGVMALSTVIGAVVSLGGIWLSYLLDLPSGPCIVLLGALLLIFVRGGRALALRRARARRGGAQASVPEPP